MKIATIDAESNTLVIRDRDKPSGGAKVLAAAINPMDQAVAKGIFPFRPFSPGDVLGYSGVAEDSHGKRHFFWGPQRPAGSYSEYVDLANTLSVELPAGLDPAIAAIIGVPGIAAAAALDVGGVTDGTTVAVLGVSGSVGLLAALVAQARGAKVIGTARDTAANRDRLATYDFRVVYHNSPSDPQLVEALTNFVPEGLDAVIDPLWGEYPTHLLQTLGVGGRWVQLGSAAGNESTVLASSFRNALVNIVGHSNFRLGDDQTASAYSEVAAIAAQGKVDLPIVSTTFDELPAVWQQLSEGTRTDKIALVP